MGNDFRIPVRRGATGLAALALAAGVLTGCSGGSDAATPGSPSTVTETVTSSPTPDSSPSASSAASDGGSDGGSGSATGTSSGTDTTGSGTTDTEAASVPLCGTPDLRARIAPQRGGGTAGATYQELSLVNRGDHPCRMKGWAGVSLVAGSDGHQVGAAADRTDADQRRYVTLIPNARAVEEIKVSAAGNYGARQCRPTQARGYRIYPPDNRESLFAARPTPACASSGVHLLSVAPVHAVS